MDVSSGSDLATPALYHAAKPTALASILGFHFTIPGRTGKAHSAPQANLGTIYRILRLAIKLTRMYRLAHDLQEPPPQLAPVLSPDIRLAWLKGPVSAPAETVASPIDLTTMRDH